MNIDTDLDKHSVKTRSTPVEGRWFHLNNAFQNQGSYYIFTKDWVSETLLESLVFEQKQKVCSSFPAVKQNFFFLKKKVLVKSDMCAQKHIPLWEINPYTASAVALTGA